MKHLFQESKINAGFFWHIDLRDQTVSTKPINKTFLSDYFKAKGINEENVMFCEGKIDFSNESKLPSKALVYFMECMGFIKIGKSDCPESRLESMQTGNPFQITLLLVVNADEKETHDRFSRQHHQGEWFRREGELDNFLKSHGV